MQAVTASTSQRSFSRWPAWPTRCGANAPLLSFENVSKVYQIRSSGMFGGAVGAFTAVDNVSLQIERGECLGLVGESGCGKTTTARCVLRAVDPTEGEVLFRAADGSIVDVAAVPRARLRPLPSQSTIAGIVSGEYDCIPEVNDSFLDLAGYSREDLLRYLVENRWHPSSTSYVNFVGLIRSTWNFLSCGSREVWVA